VLLVVTLLKTGQENMPRYVVAPTTALRTVWQRIVSAELFDDGLASLFASHSGFVMGSLARIIACLVCAVGKPAEASVDPLVSTLYPVPKIALLPVIITWLGFGDLSKIVLISLAVFFPTFINTLYGARATPTNLIWAARNMGASRLYIFWHVVLPAALPQ